MSKGTAVLNSADFTLFAERAKKMHLTNVPNKDVISKLDPVGTHVCHRAMLHGDGDFVRTWWLVKLENRDENNPLDLTFDMRVEDFNKLTRIVMNEAGEWEVVNDA